MGEHYVHSFSVPDNFTLDAVNSSVNSSECAVISGIEDAMTTYVSVIV